MRWATGQARIGSGTALSLEPDADSLTLQLVIPSLVLLLPLYSPSLWKQTEREAVGFPHRWALQSHRAEINMWFNPSHQSHFSIAQFWITHDLLMENNNTTLSQAVSRHPLQAGFWGLCTQSPCCSSNLPKEGAVSLECLQRGASEGTAR